VREFQAVGAGMLKLWAPNEVRTSGMESRLVVDSDCVICMFVVIDDDVLLITTMISYC